MLHVSSLVLFFFNDTATTEIYTLSLHDALPISSVSRAQLLDHVFHAAFGGAQCQQRPAALHRGFLERPRKHRFERSEEHTSELQSRSDLVCRLLLEKKKHLDLRATFCAPTRGLC